MAEIPNRLLASIRAAGALHNHLRTVEFKQGQILFDLGDELEAVYFPTGSIISVVSPLSSGESISVALIGADGGAGFGAALDGRLAVSKAVVVHPGSAWVCSVPSFRQTVLGNDKLFQMMFHHEQKLTAEIQQLAVCIAAHDVEQRLASLLLRMRDLARTDQIFLTQEQLAELLAVRRTSVSPVAVHFQNHGLISYARGKMSLLNVDRLNEAACECYNAVKDTQHL